MLYAWAADEHRLKGTIKHIAKKGRESLGTKGYQKYGTPMQVAIALGILVSEVNHTI